MTTLSRAGLPASRPDKTVALPEILALLPLNETSTQPKSQVPMGEPLFQPLTSQVVFRDYEAFQTYTKTLYLRNNDNVARRIKLMPCDSPYFSVSAPKPMKLKNAKGSSDSKIAAGMEVSIKITFKPREKKSYVYRLICMTEREKFVIPLLAHGTKPCLDFPDEVIFRSTPCKSVGSETFMVRNLGNSPATFTMACGPPFAASAKDKFVPIGGTTQVTVTFAPQDTEKYQQEQTGDHHSAHNPRGHTRPAACCVQTTKI